jgi:hypothetical protein
VFLPTEANLLFLFAGMAPSILQETGGTKNLRAGEGETFDTQVFGNSTNCGGGIQNKPGGVIGSHGVMREDDYRAALGIYGLIFDNAAIRISSIGGLMPVHNSNCIAA